MTSILIQSLDKTAWDAIETEWKASTKMEEDATIKITKEVVNPRGEWNNVEKKLAQANAKALNTIFAGVDKEKFKLICTCTSVEMA